MTVIREGNQAVLLVVDVQVGISYPGRTNGTALAEDIDFSVPSGVR